MRPFVCAILTKMKKNLQNIHILCNTSKIAGRRVLQGVLRFAAEHFEWRLRIWESTMDDLDAFIAEVNSCRANGLISCEMETPKVARVLERSNIPLVVVGTRETCIPSRKTNVAFVTHDERALGAAAARYFLSLGKFCSCGFVHFKEPAYQFLSRLREEGFESVMTKSCGLDVRQYRIPANANNDAIELGKWLAELPKPACVLGAFDKRAAEVIHACEEMNVSIPEEVRVLGIDNDEFTCQATAPQLSSIATDCETEGYMAAARLNSLMRGKKRNMKRESVICHARCDVATRGSTKVLAPGRELVRRAREYIEANAERTVSVDDIANYLHASKCLLHLRFREFARKSIQTTINEARINFVKRKLSSSKQTIDSIAKSCGFRNTNYLKTLFKKMTGMTMREWRKTH